MIKEIFPGGIIKNQREMRVIEIYFMNNLVYPIILHQLYPQLYI